MRSGGDGGGIAVDRGKYCAGVARPEGVALAVATVLCDEIIIMVRRRPRRGGARIGGDSGLSHPLSSLAFPSRRSAAGGG